MMISTKGRYALRVMIDLAEHHDGSFIPLKAVAERQEISHKYLEAIVSSLSKAGFVDGVHGKGGGYRLNRAPERYRLIDILSLTENSLAAVACLECGAEPCPRAAQCRTLPMWSKLNAMVNNYLSSVTIADLMHSENQLYAD